jgi:hypothetical protein
MVNTRLRIGTESNFGIFDNIPIDITYQISDVREPSEKKVSGSKTIVIPASQEANILFENLFEVNVALQTFNPALKTDVTYYVDELVVFDGYLQLLKVNLNETSGRVTYECNMIGELGNVFNDISGLYLTDLNWENQYPFYAQHQLGYAAINASWGAGAGGGAFVYPIIDWGLNNSNLSYIKPQHLRPCLFAWDIMDFIFSSQGYSWTSTFLDSTYFKRLIIPPNDAVTTLDATTLSNNKFLAYVDATQTETFTVTRPFTTILDVAANNFTVEYPTDSSPGYDTGNIYDNTTFTFTVPVTNTYNLNANLSVNMEMFYDNGGGPVDVSQYIYVGQTGTLYAIIYNGTTSVASNSINFANINWAASNVNNLVLNMPNVPLVANNQYTVKFGIQAGQFQIIPDQGVGTYSLAATIAAGNFSAEFASNSIYEGATVYANDILPKNIKQYDFVKSIFRMFNLYAVVDKSNPNNYLIEQRPTFYKPFTQALDWSLKHDENSNTEIIPLGELNNVKYKWTYKDDGDFYNVDYKNNYSETYGTHEEVIVNDFIKGEQTTDVIFSPTPYAVNPNFAMVVATIFKKDNLQIAPIKPNIRILYYSGAIALPNTQWTFVTQNGNFVYTNYAHAGHTNNPYSPGLDLNWGLPKKVYYNYPNLQWTTRNLYNEYYSQYFEQITDKDSKIVITDFYLTPTDIAQLDLRYPIYFRLKGNQAYYTINKVLSYNPQVSKTTRVELLKLADKDLFVEGTYAFNDSPGGDGSHSQNRISNGNVNTGGGINLGEYSLISGGQANFIAQGAQSVQLLNCTGVVVNGDVESFVGIGLSNVVIDYTYSDTILNGNEASTRVTTSLTLDRTYHNRTVYVDATAGDITLTWNCSTMKDVNVNIVRYDSSINKIYITDVGSFGTETFIGQSLPYDMGLIQYDAVPITSYTDTIYINK